MNLSIGEKLLLIRESEMIGSRVKAAELLDIPSNALWRYESGEAIPKGDVIMKILSHPVYEKYALWFTTGKIAPEYGQIKPVLLEQYLQDRHTSLNKKA
ncbi:TPA: XRE family transcriptional regulator [Vibrio vulnificus]|nr:XRE family transcriptional regulator [Vibrio vulnificus]